MQCEAINTLTGESRLAYEDPMTFELTDYSGKYLPRDQWVVKTVALPKWAERALIVIGGILTLLAMAAPIIGTST